MRQIFMPVGCWIAFKLTPTTFTFGVIAKGMGEQLT